MKKYALLVFATLLAVAFAAPAFALENQFGGYWRTRFTYEGNFDGDDDIDDTDKYVDTRTRLYYTAKLNDNLQLVNKFEFDGEWGSAEGSRAAGAPTNKAYTQFGADGVNIEIKHSFVDWKMGPVNFKVGVQDFYLFRGLAIDDDAAGAKAIWKISDGIILAGSWYKILEGQEGNNNDDLDSYTVATKIYFSKNFSIQPSITYQHAGKSNTLIYSAVDPQGLAYVQANPGATADGLDIFVYGIDLDGKWDNFGLWGDFAMQNGSAKFKGASDLDLKGWVAALGGNVNFGMVDVHGQFVYATGDDDPTDSDAEGWVGGAGNSYYWSEIMGFGIFDNEAPNNCPGDQVTNVWFAGVGATVKPMPKLAVAVDLWYAELAEEILVAGSNEDKLGTELDVKVTYQLVEGLNLDVVGAYLWAGDAVNGAAGDDADPVEIGARLSLSF